MRTGGEILEQILKRCAWGEDLVCVGGCRWCSYTGVCVWGGVFLVQVYSGMYMGLVSKTRASGISMFWDPHYSYTNTHTHTTMCVYVCVYIYKGDYMRVLLMLRRDGRSSACLCVSVCGCMCVYMCVCIDHKTCMQTRGGVGTGKSRARTHTHTHKSKRQMHVRWTGTHASSQRSHPYNINLNPKL